MVRARCITREPVFVALLRSRLIDIASLEKVSLVLVGQYMPAVRSARGLEPCPKTTHEVLFCPAHLPLILVQVSTETASAIRGKRAVRLGIEAPMMLALGDWVLWSSLLRNPSQNT